MVKSGKLNVSKRNTLHGILFEAIKRARREPQLVVGGRWWGNMDVCGGERHAGEDVSTRGRVIGPLGALPHGHGHGHGHGRV